VYEPQGTFSIIELGVNPVLMPFCIIVAPVGTELTDIFPTVDTALEAARSQVSKRELNEFFSCQTFLSFK
jgi:hypothetical protein